MSDLSTAMRRTLNDAVKIDRGVLRYVLDQARDCIKILGPDGRVDYINSEARCALGIADPAATCGKHWPALWPENSRPIIESALAKARSGEGTEVEAARPDSTGESRWWRVSVSPLVERDGEVTGILTISRDVSSHVALRESEKTLALEMRHRLRNAYTVASAIVMQSASRDPLAQSFAESVCNRLADVALSQTRLLDAGEKSWKLSDLVRVLVEAHGEGPTSIRVAGESNASVDAHEAMLVALVVGELTNNSLKYGALRQRRSVTLSWGMDRGVLAIEWREPLHSMSDGSFQPRDVGSGYSMMERMARSQRALFNHEITGGELSVRLELARPSA